MKGWYESRPWVTSYDHDVTPAFVPRFSDGLSAFRRAARSAPDRDAILYFDRRMSYGELDQHSDALATVLWHRGLRRGDRLALYLQNVPPFIISLVGAWKLGVVPVPINPMNRERELSILLGDSAPKAIVCHDGLFMDVLNNVPERPPITLTTSPLDYQTRHDPRLFSGMTRAAVANAEDFCGAIDAARGAQSPGQRDAGPGDLAFLVYTSGTTGIPKGAMNTHESAIFSAENMSRWLKLAEGAPVLALAPLFHITGLVCHVLTAFVMAAPLVISYRFEPGVMLDSIDEHQPEFMVGAITAFIAMMAHPSVRKEQFRPLRRVCSGGAPVPPSVAAQFRAKLGHCMLNGYGLTETNAPVIFAPTERESRVDPRSGTLSIGLPLPMIDVWICDDNGSPAPWGKSGEIVIAGRSVAPGYWNKPEETAAAMRQDGFRTGDIGFMDADGWVYVIDRKKDMINAGGYKVWPREVEDVLYAHPAIREAAVVGVADPYRGETVKAVVSLKPSHKVSSDEIIGYCKERMAAYKYPRIVEIIDDLPKTTTGKILRRAFR